MMILAGMGPAFAQPRAVIELFTSQGCSSCPPADRLLTRWAQDPDLIALSLSVDYWDYLGWKDTLANHDFSMRQHAYSDVRGDRAVYTPQIVVDGVLHAVGSNSDEVDRAIDTAGSKVGVLSVPVSIAQAGGNYTVSLGRSTARGEVWVVPVEHQAAVKIERGENVGKTVTYTNVVRNFRKVAEYDGSAQTLTLKPEDFAAPGADSFAVLLQSTIRGKPGAILGAAMKGP
jgi:hypothetical protein